MELLDHIYQSNYVYLFAGGLVDFCIEETVGLLELTIGECQHEDYVYEIVCYAAEILSENCWAPRQHRPSDIKQGGVDQVITKLMPYRGMEQGTAEWHKFRDEHLTASSIWKALSSEASFNALVRDKTEEKDLAKILSVNLDSTLHWGHKYEPVSIMIYERDNATSVGEFGCVPSESPAFLAASPDGINLDSSSAKYGRMLEVKNIVNREITGIPKPEYWVQMQVQMAVCKLTICDFLETRFKEVESVDEMLEGRRDGKEVGCMALFLNAEGKPVYDMAPLGIRTRQVYEAWNFSMMDKNTRLGLQWVKNDFWVLDEMLVTEVRYDDCWYKRALPEFEACWEKVLAVRAGECDLPARKRRKASQEPARVDSPLFGKCLL